MPSQSRWSVPIPRTSLSSYIFTSPTVELSRAPLYIDTDRPETDFLSLHTYREWSKRFAAGLLTAGLQPGDRVLLCSTNSVLFPVVVMGVIMAGGIYTSGNPSFLPRELTHQLKDSGAKFLLTIEASLAVALEAASSAGMPHDKIFIFDNAPLNNIKGTDKKGIRHWDHLIASPEVGRRFAWKECVTIEETNQTVVLNYSSGTTGLPKGVESTHYNYIANCAQVIHQLSLDPLFSTPEAVARKSRWLCAIPLYHGFAQIQFGTVAAKRVVPTYIMRKYNYKEMIKNIERFKISELTLVPPIVVTMANDPNLFHGEARLNSVVRVFCGAAPLSRDISKKLEKIWPSGKVNVKQGCGMSETTCMILGWDPRLHSTSASVGELLANCEGKLMDDEGLKEVPLGQKGELWCRAPNVMKGYWKNPEETKETITEDGWLKTGDILYIDEQGMYHIVDRKKEMIKVGGVQVAPAELEALLHEHPHVLDAAVIGVRSQENGDEKPRAYIVLKSHVSASQNAIISFVSSRCSKPKRITGGVAFVDQIPKTAAGKILRKLLRKRAEAELKSGTQKAARL